MIRGLHAFEPCQSSRSVAQARRIAVLGTRMSISSLVRMSMTSFPAFTLVFVRKYSCLYNEKEITRRLKDMNYNILQIYMYYGGISHGKCSGCSSIQLNFVLWPGIKVATATVVHTCLFLHISQVLPFEFLFFSSDHSVWCSKYSHLSFFSLGSVHSSAC